MTTKDKLKIVIDENEDKVYSVDYFKNCGNDRFLIWLYHKKDGIETYEKYEIELLSKKDNFISFLINHKPHEIKIEEVEGGYRIGKHLLKIIESLPGFKTVDKYRQISNPNYIPKKRIKKKLMVENAVTALMPGKIVKIKVKRGDVVKLGEPLCILEAMKMENEILASRIGKIKEIRIKEGSIVQKDDILIVYE